MQAHGPGFSKILLGDDVVDAGTKYLDLMVESVLRQQRPRLHQLLGHLGLAAHARDRRGPGRADWARSKSCRRKIRRPAWRHSPCRARRRRLEDRSKPTCAKTGVEHIDRADSARGWSRCERCAYLRPTIVHCESPQAAIAKKEYMFPFATVVECPQEKMIEAIGPTLVCTAITDDATFQRRLTDATHIDRLNIGPIPTIKLDWLQPHEGNIVEFLFRAARLPDPAGASWRALKAVG